MTCGVRNVLGESWWGRMVGNLSVGRIMDGSLGRFAEEVQGD